MKRRAVEGEKKLSKKNINRDFIKNTVSCKQAVTGSRFTATKRKRVSEDLL